MSTLTRVAVVADFPAPRHLLCHSLVQMLQDTGRAMAARREARRLTRGEMVIGDGLLRDIGMTRADLLCGSMRSGSDQ